MSQFVDLVLLAGIGVSALFGWLRGVCTEITSLLGWFIALWLTLLWTPKVTIYIKPYIQDPTLQIALAAFAIFFLCLLAVNALSVVLKTLMSMLGLGVVDRLLGLGFGLFRGGLLLGGLILMGIALGLHENHWWQQSKVIPSARSFSMYCWQKMPNGMIKPIEQWVQAQWSGSDWMAAVKKSTAPNKRDA